MIEEVHDLFDGDVVVLTSTIDEAHVAELTDAEAALVAGAIDRRRHEFATGRRLAREALARLGVPAREILRERDRAPSWPEGIAGSLTHCHVRAFAAVGRRDDVGAIGIDTEKGPGLAEDLWSHVFTDDERRSLRAISATLRARAALIAFSAKESLYKAQYPLTWTFMDFTDARVELPSFGPDAVVEGRLTCIFQRTVGRFEAGTACSGRFRYDMAEDIVVTSVQLRS